MGQNNEAEKQAVISEMLKERTATSILDSGGYYGYNWQRNQERDFGKEPETIIKVEDGFIEAYFNTYHWLVNTLEYNQRVDKELQKVFNNSEDGYEEDIKTFINSAKFEELCGEPLRVERENSYNFDCFLDQTLLYTFVETESGDYLFLQIHNGCDVRGGYTTPHAFIVDSDLTFFRYSQCILRCENEHDFDYWELEKFGIVPLGERKEGRTDVIYRKGGKLYCFCGKELHVLLPY